MSDTPALFGYLPEDLDEGEYGILTPFPGTQVVVRKAVMVARGSYRHQLDVGKTGIIKDLKMLQVGETEGKVVVLLQVAWDQGSAYDNSLWLSLQAVSNYLNFLVSDKDGHKPQAPTQIDKDGHKPQAPTQIDKMVKVARAWDAYRAAKEEEGQSDESLQDSDEFKRFYLSCAVANHQRKNPMSPRELMESVKELYQQIRTY